MARGKRGVVQVALDAANVARSSIPLPNSTANWPVSLPMRALTIDATVRIGVATTTNSEFRRVEGPLATMVKLLNNDLCRARIAVSWHAINATRLRSTALVPSVCLGNYNRPVKPHSKLKITLALSCSPSLASPQARQESRVGGPVSSQGITPGTGLHAIAAKRKKKKNTIRTT